MTSAGGFGGMSLSYIVSDEARVAEILAAAEKAGATVVQPATKAQWGGTTGHFTDPDGFLWQVAAGTTPQPVSAE
jgi:uncharacterized protein